MDTTNHLETSLESLEEGAAKCKTVEDYVRLVQTYRGKGPYERIAAAQVNAEFAALMKRLQKENIRYACEIGTMNGCSAGAMTPRPSTAPSTVIAGVIIPSP